MPEPVPMRPLKDLLEPSRALELILEACRAVEEQELVPAELAAGRVLAADVVALHDVPAFDRAAMDGYAVRSEDLQGPARLRLVGNVHAGDPGAASVRPGECVQIATGAPIPEGADAVVMVERTQREGDLVRFEAPVVARENVAARRSDLRAQDVVLRAGEVLQPARVAVAAAAGAGRVRVWRRPRVAILSTGAELVPPGLALARGQLYDSNGPALAAFVRAAGGDVLGPDRCPDEVAVLRNALRGYADADIILTSGGSSAGERDVLRDAMGEEGSVIFHGVKVKPGKPLLLGRLGHTPVVGLPGYPTSCLMDAYLFVRPALLKIARQPAAPERRLRAPLAEPVKPVPDRLWCVPVRVRDGRVYPTFRGSGATSSLADAQGYIEIPAGIEEWGAGTPVDVLLF